MRRKIARTMNKQSTIRRDRTTLMFRTTQKYLRSNRIYLSKHMSCVRQTATRSSVCEFPSESKTRQAKNEWISRQTFEICSDGDANIHRFVNTPTCVFVNVSGTTDIPMPPHCWIQYTLGRSCVLRFAIPFLRFRRFHESRTAGMCLCVSVCAPSAITRNQMHEFVCRYFHASLTTKWNKHK